MKNKNLFYRALSILVIMSIICSFVGCTNTQDNSSIIEEVEYSGEIEYVYEDAASNEEVAQPEESSSSEEAVAEENTTENVTSTVTSGECTHADMRCVMFEGGEYGDTDRYALVCNCGYKDILELPNKSPLTVNVKKVEYDWENEKNDKCPDESYESYEIRKDGVSYLGEEIEKIFYINIFECGRISAYYHSQHHFTDWNTVVPATLTSEGSAERHCVVCKYQETCVIEKLREEDIGKTDEQIFWEHFLDGIDLSGWDGTCSCCGRMCGDGYNGTCKFGGVTYVIDKEAEEVYEKHTCITYLENGEEVRTYYRGTDDKEVWIKLDE